jgi:tyrocidine synthetase-3
MNRSNQIESKNIQDILALTPMQEGMLFHYLQAPREGSYFNQLSLELSGDINLHYFEEAWNFVLETNEMLRTAFRWEKLEKPTQVVLKKHTLHWKYEDLSNAGDSVEPKKQWENIKQQDRLKPFDLRQVPFRVILGKISQNRYQMLISNHHILYDGWSTGIILKEFFQAYETLAMGNQPLVPRVKSGFKEFIQWHREQDRVEQKKSWQNYLEGFDTPTRLPVKRSPAGPGMPGKSNHRVHLSQEIKNKVEGFVKDKRITLAAVFYCAWGILLQKYCGIEDVVFGTTVSGRSAPIRGIEDMVGLFINTIPLRAGSEPGEGLMDFLVRINRHLAAGEKYENTPLVDIYRCCRQLTQVREELFDTLVSMENYPLDTYLRDPGSHLSIQSYEMEEKPHYDLTMVISAASGIDIDFIYDNTCFDKETIVRLAHHFGTILKGIGEDIENRPHAIEILSDEEKQQLLVDFNRTAAAYPEEKTIYGLFEEQVERVPEHTALVGAAPYDCPALPVRLVQPVRPVQPIFLTYHELNERTGKLAGLLLGKGVLPGDITAIMVKRSLEMVIGILGILKAGGAYLPIDPGYPGERIDYMLKDSKAQTLVVDDTSCASWLSFAPKVLLNLSEGHHLNFPTSQLPSFPASLPSSLAYIIYTSGSTGKPKGVMIEHGPVVNLLFSLQRRYPLREQDTYLLKTSYLFDVSVTELFGWFLEGGRLAVLEPGGEKDPKAILEMIAREGVTHIDFVPSMFHTFVEILGPREIVKLAGLKYIFLAGEALLPGPVNRFRRLNTSIAIENIYGPTEAAVYASWYSLAEWKGEASIPIGKPLPNVTLYIVDKWGYLQPIGVPGELCIGGGGLARGYLNNPELTIDRFLSIFNRSYRTYIPKRLYATGDLARWLPDGNIEFLGRMDFQVKVRGFRIELGEIENWLVKHPGVKEAVVAAHKDTGGEVRLCAYVVGEAGQDELHGYLSGVLPGYMVPAYFEKIGAIPSTASGKIDRRALPAPAIKSMKKYTAPGNEIEAALVDTWAEVLKIDKKKIGIDDNFFELGGHSLNATALVSKIHKKLKFQFQLQQVFEISTIRAQAAYMAKQAENPYVYIEADEEKEYYDLSYAQRRLWVLCQFEEDSAAYNMPRAQAISGEFDSSAFIKAGQALAHRHESLRTIFIQVDGTPRQKVVKDFTFGLESIDLRELDPGEREKKAREIFIKDANRAFDLRHGPLFRFTLVRLEDKEYVLIFNIHHIINDGWSQGIIHNEIIGLYNAFLGESGDKNLLPALPLQYRDYARWHNRCIDTGRFDVPGQYWLEKFKDKPNGIELPQDYPRRPVQTFNGGRITRGMGKERTRQFHRIALEQDVTLFMCLLTLLNIFLYKYTGQTGIIIGAPIAGRGYTELHPVVGFLVNTLVYRCQVDPDRSFKQLLTVVKEETLACYRNQDYPYDRLVEELELDRDLSQSPLFNVMLAHNNAETQDSSLTMKNVQMTRYVHADDYNMSKFDLIFFMDEIEDQVWLQLEYNSDLFALKTIERMAENFLVLIENVTGDIHAPVSTVSCLSESEYRRVIHEFNSTHHPFPPLSIQELLEKQVVKSKDKTALVYNEDHISYEVLNGQTNRYAHYLKEDHGISPNRVIGISMDRSTRMICVLLGIIKSGGAYLAVDPAYPRERVLHVLSDSQAGLLITDMIRPGFFEDYPGQIIEIDRREEEIIRKSQGNPPLVNQPGDILYVNYTSGSTGMPNGAMLSHGLLSNLIHWQREKSMVDCSLRCLQFTTINFCVSFQEILGTLTSGGQLYLIGEVERQDIDYLMDFLSRDQIENLFLPFSYLNFLFTETGRWHESFKHNLKHIITAGEQLKVTPGLKAFLEQSPWIKLHNHYGSTEMHVVTSYTLDASTAAQTPIPPAGKPISNTRIYILDEYFNPVPVGVWGEIFAAGTQEFTGYINNLSLTGKKLIAHTQLPPGEEKIRLYRTGDMGRWLANGNIEFKGRKDFQVKIRGFRVELGEIETQLLGHEKVKEATVIVRDETGKDKYLCAYVVAGSKETGIIEPIELREYLAGRLPDYMLPSYFVQLDKIPLTPNGKVDKEALPAPGKQEEKDYAAPRDNLEKKLVDIWSGILGIAREKISINDNFFHLGGHSLKATVLVSRINKELGVKIPLTEVFINPYIRRLAAFVKNAGAQRFFSIEAVEKKEYYILSSAQRRLLVLQRMEEKGIAYNMPSVWQLQGSLDVEKFAAVFQQLIRRHESLRTSFHMVNDEPVQRINEKIEVKVEVEEERASRLEGTRGLAPLSFFRPFDLARAPLFRVGLIKLLHTPSAHRGHPSQEGKWDKYLLMVDMHHIISDGVSTGIFVREFMELYAGKEPSALRLQYKDYSEWHKRQALEKPIKQQEAYWLKEFSGEIPVLDLSTDYPRPLVQDFAGHTISFEIDKEETAALKSLANEQGSTLFMLALSLYTACLSRISGQEEILVGTPIAGRRHADLQSLMGMFVNTLVLRSFPLGSKPFNQFLTEVKDNTIKAFENQDYLYEDLVEQVDLERDTGRNPLFDTMFALQNFDALKIEIPGLKVQCLEYEIRISKFDLMLAAVEIEDHLAFTFEYCTKLFKEETIRRFIRYFTKTISTVIDSHDITISGIEIIDEEEKNRILHEFNDTTADYPRDKTIHRLFEEQVERTPNHAALVGVALDDHPGLSVRPVYLTYRELNEKSNRLAYRLLEKGVCPDTIIGIMIERSMEMIIGILGILKPGGAYLPIDPGYPQERIDYMLKDSGAEILLKDNDLTRIPPSPLLPFYPSSPLNLAYIIYTSGSTGRPKGVMVEHGSVVNLLFGLHRRYPLREQDTYLLKTSYLFDVSVTELFGWFLEGGRLAVLPPGGEKDPGAIRDMIAREGVTHINFVPSMFHTFVEILDTREIARLAGMKYIFLAGEALPAGLVNRVRVLNTPIAIENIYGPTEAAVYASWYSLAGWKGEASIPIGKPLPNVNLYIVDKWEYLQPIGVPGELCIGGVGLARGYLNKPALTMEKFVFYRSYRSYMTYIPKKLYKTGDLARWLLDGNVEFLGRIDQQVKIRGFRVELGEIENRLLEYDQIKEIVVVLKTGEHDDKYLCAYFVPKSSPPGKPGYSIKESGLREYLLSRLPGYMVPSYFVLMDKLPLTSNGKIDRKALPVPGIKTGDNYEAPRGRIEKKLVGIWSGVLGIEREKIGINDNFFHLGGHSLKATILASRIHKELKVNVPLPEIFKTSHIRGLAAFITNAETEKFFSIEAVEKKEYYILSSAQRRLLVLQQMDEKGMAYNMPSVWQLQGDIDEAKFASVFQQLVQRHESLRTSFHMVNDESVQRIKEKVEVKVEVEKERASRLEGTRGLVPLSFIRPFDLSRAPLFRVGLLEQEEQKNILIVDMHHIISDGMSIGILVKEFTELYAGKEPPALRLQYKDYSEWHNRQALEETVKQQEAYWLKEFSGEIPVLDLPTDYPRPLVQDFAGRSVQFEIDQEETNALKSLANEQGVTLFMLLLSVYTIFLSRVSGQEDIVVGTPAAGRRHADLQHIIGMFVNTLVLQNFPGGEKSFTQLVKEVKEHTLNAFENQDYPFEDLVEHLEVKRDTGRNPLFDTMFILQNLDIPTIDTPGLKPTPYPYELDTAKFDLTLVCIEDHDRLSCLFEYSTGLYKPETIERFILYLKNILWAIKAKPGINPAGIDILPGEEKRRLVLNFNGTAEDFPVNKTVYQLFEEQVDRYPDHAALVGGTLRGGVDTLGQPMYLTYRELDEEANRLAHYLRLEKGVEVGDRVAVLMERCLEMIVSLLGIMKAGAAYVPLDPSLPVQRLRVIFNDAATSAAITQEKSREKLQSPMLAEVPDFHSLVCMDAAGSEIHRQPVTRPGIKGAGNPAYVMYTSGSSGTPKGVVVEHRTIVNTLIWRKKFYGYQPGDVSLQNPPYFFDSSVTDIFTPLLGGARLVSILEKDRLNSRLLGKVIKIHCVSHVIFIPAFYNVLLEESGSDLSGVRMITAAGENFPDGLIKKHFDKLPQVRIFNEYGPTENSVNTTAYELTPGSVKALIGKPISNATVYVMDRYLNFCPTGVGGEMCLGGSSLARGYLNQPQLTHEKFLPLAGVSSLFNAFNAINTSNKSNMSYPVRRIYRTGDLGRWCADGNLEFLGRVDSQIKIRGIRIETGEIENQLSRHGNVNEVVVIALSSGGDEKYLCAYVVLSGVQVEKSEEAVITELKAYLSDKLPDYMIPLYFKVIDAVPFTPGGKIDREALPMPGIPGVSLGRGTVPRDRVELELARIWSSVLDIPMDMIGIDDNFFQLGGHSLRAMIIASRIHKAFNVDVPLAGIFKTPFIRGLAEHITHARQERYAAVEPVEKKEYYALSPAQKRLYLLQQMDPAGVSYNLPQLIFFDGEVDKPRLEWTFNRLLSRHESLRTSFHMTGGEPVQRIHEENYNQDLRDYGNTPEIQSKVFGSPGPFFQKGSWPPEAIIESFIRPFDLSRAPLLRAGLVKLEDRKHLLVIDMHHIITDGASQAVLEMEFNRLYAGDNQDLPGLRLQYKDYAQWQAHEKQQDIIKQQESYWLEMYSHGVPVLNLPLDYPRPLLKSFAGNTVDFRLSREQSQALGNLAGETGTTLYMVISAIFNLVLTKLSGQEDIVVGMPIAGRRHADLEFIIGMFVNTLPLRYYPVGEKRFKDFLQEVKIQALQAYENQEYPFEELVDRLQLKRDAGRNPLFDVMFNLLNLEEHKGEFPGRDENRHKKGTSKFDLSLIAVEAGDRLVFTFEYCTHLFKPATIDRYISYFKKAVDLVSVKPGQELRQVEIITEKEKQQLLYEFNSTEARYPGDKTVDRLFAEQAKRNPDCIALLGAALCGCLAPDDSPVRPVQPVCLTYNELNMQSDRLAYWLVEKGVQADSIVGVKTGPGIELMIGIIGILKSGAAYLPLDPNTPPARIEYILKDSAVKILLTPGTIVSLVSQPPAFGRRQLESGRRLPAASLAYVIYTSGSTGCPKGAGVEHTQLVNFVYHMYDNYGRDIDTRDCCLGITNIMFDVSIWEFFLPLLFGAGLSLLPEEKRFDARAVAAAILREEITLVYIPPALLEPVYEHLVKGRTRVRLNKMLVGVEPIRDAVLENYVRLVPHMRIINGYGPTETTICATSLNYRTHEPQGEIVPIGKPLSNNQVVLLDGGDCLVPLGAAGEICISGDGVSRGYINNPVMTAEKYTVHPYFKGRRMYRSGDLARWLPGGNIRFIGRQDSQVKIRGYRIELGEIEKQLKAHPDIKDAVVIDRNDRGRRYLCAYIVVPPLPDQPPGQETITVSRLKEYLEGKLPGYMVPACFVTIEKIPLNPSGKVDRSKLPQPFDTDFHPGEAYEPPTNNLQQIIAGIWQEVLGREKVGTRDNFFDMGGNSLDFVKVSTRLKEELERDIPVVTLFTYPTIRSLELYLTRGTGELREPEEPADEGDEPGLIDEGKNLMQLTLGKLDEEDDD